MICVAYKERTRGFTYRVVAGFGDDEAEALLQFIRREMDDAASIVDVRSLHFVRASKRIGNGKCIPNQCVTGRGELVESLRKSGKPAARALGEELAAYKRREEAALAPTETVEELERQLASIGRRA